MTVCTRVLTFVSFADSLSKASCPVPKTLQRRLVAGLFAACLLLGITTQGFAQSDTRSGAGGRSIAGQTRHGADKKPVLPMAQRGIFPPPMSVARAQYFKNNPAAWSEFLSKLKQQPSPSARSSNRKQSPGFGGTWQNAAHLAPSYTCNPLLLTDGTVIVSNCDFSGAWYRLTPDNTGSYVNGTWSSIAPMPVIGGTQYAPLYFASAVLPDGRVITMGGEYNNGSGEIWTSLGAIYDPVANAWTPVSAPSGTGWTGTGGNGGIGDAESVVLANGTFMLAACCAYPDVDALFNPTTLTWTATGAPNAGFLYQDEQGYTLLPNGNVLTIDIWTNVATSGNATNAEQYNPSTGVWSGAGNTPVSLPDSYACGTFEIGPAALRPDGTVVAFGGNTDCTGLADPTAIYDSTSGLWSLGPNIPSLSATDYNLADAPAAVLPNGNVLFAASPGYGNSPTHFFEFTAANAINQVADTAQFSSEEGAYTYNFLVLPTGQIFSTDFSNVPEFYTPAGSPDPSWAPAIATSPSNVYPGTTYSITGSQLNGLSQGAYYGDDVQAATNYPIVQITNSATGHVFYGRTFSHSSRSIAPGATGSTNFTVPGNIELGPSSLVVIANGIPSAPVPIGVAVPSVGVSSSQNPSVYGQSVAFTATVTGASPSGTVQFNVDSAPFGSPVTLAGGTATSGNISTLAAGTHTVTAVYSGDANNAGGTGSLAGGQAVNMASVVVGVTSNLNPSNYGQSVTFTATISGQFGLVKGRQGASRHKPLDVGGSVTWSANTGCGTTSVTPGHPGVATCTTSSLTAGNDVISAAYSGDSNHTANSGTLAGGQQVNQQVLSASPGSVDFGNKVIGGSHTKNVLLENGGSTNIMIGAVSITTTGGDPSAFTFHEFCAHPLKPGKKCVIGVTFRTNVLGLDTATLNIPSSAPGGPLEVSLSGTGIKRK